MLIVFRMLFLADFFSSSVCILSFPIKIMPQSHIREKALLMMVLLFPCSSQMNKTRSSLQGCNFTLLKRNILSLRKLYHYARRDQCTNYLSAGSTKALSKLLQTCPGFSAVISALNFIFSSNLTKFAILIFIIQSWVVWQRLKFRR